MYHIERTTRSQAITDYTTAAAYLGAKADRPLPGKFTRLIRNADGSISVRYHSTAVVTYHADGSITLNSGGYRTITTKARIGQYTFGVSIWQKQGVWSLSAHGKTYPFADGITLTAQGKVKGTASKAAIKKQESLRRQVRTYAKAYIQALYAGKVPAPSGGDCWHCVGIIGDTDHFLSHFKERYYVPSLIKNAIADFPVSRWTENVLYTIWRDGGPTGDRLDTLAQKQLRQSVIKYLDRQFGIG